MGKTRLIEMYVGLGADSGTWHTEYVEIPRDTPEGELEEAAMKAGREQIESFCFIGVYCFTEMDEDEFDDEKEDDEYVNYPHKFE